MSTTNETKQIDNLGVKVDSDRLYTIANKNGDNVLFKDKVFLTAPLAYQYIWDYINDGHIHMFAYTGTIPCTGLKVCFKCCLIEDLIE